MSSESPSRPWLIFIYKVPNEPSARRVYVWRKLRALGAILLQDSAWVLPATQVTREKLEWLAAEVGEMRGGEAMLWEGRLTNGQDADLVHKFTAQVDEVYSGIAGKLKLKAPDLAALSRQFQLANRQDYFQSELGRRVRRALIGRREAAK
jgi:hypothetical protein